MILLDDNKIKDLNELMGDDFSILVDSYTNDGHLLVTELKANIGRYVAEDVRKMHSIKSTSLNMGAVAVVELARELEQQLKDGQPLTEEQWLILSQIFSQTTDSLVKLVS